MPWKQPSFQHYTSYFISQERAEWIKPSGPQMKGILKNVSGFVLCSDEVDEETVLMVEPSVPTKFGLSEWVNSFLKYPSLVLTEATFLSFNKTTCWLSEWAEICSADKSIEIQMEHHKQLVKAISADRKQNIFSIFLNQWNVYSTKVWTRSAWRVFEKPLEQPDPI